MLFNRSKPTRPLKYKNPYSNKLLETALSRSENLSLPLREPFPRWKVETYNQGESSDSPCTFKPNLTSPTCPSKIPVTREHISSQCEIIERSPWAVDSRDLDFLRDQKRPWRYPTFSSAASRIRTEKHRVTWDEVWWLEDASRGSTVSHGRFTYPGGFVSTDFKVAVGRASLCHDLRNLFHSVLARLL